MKTNRVVKRFMGKRIFITTVLAFLSALLFTTSDACAGSANEILVSAAISLKNAFEEIGKIYEAKSKGKKVSFNFGSGNIREVRIHIRHGETMKYRDFGGKGLPCET